MEIQEQLAALEKRIRELEAIEGIRDTIARYSWAVDNEDWAGIDAIYTDDAVIENKWRNTEFTGKKDIIKFWQQSRAKMKDSSRMSNLNERITLEGETGKAESYILAMYAYRGESRLALGVYRWQLRYENNMWRIFRMVIAPSLMTTLERGWGMETDRLVEPPPLE